MTVSCAQGGPFGDGTCEKELAAGPGRGESWAETQLLRKLSCSYALLGSWDGLSQVSQMLFLDQSPDPGGPHEGRRGDLGQSHSLQPSTMPRTGFSCEPSATSNPGSWGKEMGASSMQGAPGKLAVGPLRASLPTTICKENSV